jgi:hypothetical protein
MVNETGRASNQVVQLRPLAGVMDVKNPSLEIYAVGAEPDRSLDERQREKLIDATLGRAVQRRPYDGHVLEVIPLAASDHDEELLRSLDLGLVADPRSRSVGEQYHLQVVRELGEEVLVGLSGVGLA